MGKGAPGFAGTIEFYPEEGKYHWDGHRKCGVCLKPTDTDAAGGICPVCKGKLTIGVSHRVEQLADRPEGYVKPDAKKFEVCASPRGHCSVHRQIVGKPEGGDGI